MLFLMSTHNICFNGEIRKIFTWYSSYLVLWNIHAHQKVGNVLINPCPTEPGYTLPLQQTVDPDQLASQEANKSGSALFAIKYVNV